MRSVKLLLALSATALMVGCASTPAPSVSYSPRYEAVDFEVDHQKMNVVDNKARQRGVRVVWVNPPVKRVPVTEQR